MVAPSAKTKIHLYFSAEDLSFLKAEERVLDRGTTWEDLGKAIVKALIDGPSKQLMRTVPKETRIKAFFIADNGITWLSFIRTQGDSLA